MMKSELRRLVKWMVYEYVIGNNKKAKMILRVIQKHSNIDYEKLSMITKSEVELFESLHNKGFYEDISDYSSECILSSRR